jgi:CelD/BcsL family acetyltransferase involved in cellulose biosynthesis
MSGDQEYQIERISDFALAPNIKETWESLMSNIEDAPVFLTWDWVTTWWRYFGEGRKLLVLAAKDSSGELVGIAPWMIARQDAGCFSVRRVSFIGDGVISPAHMDIIARPENRPAVCRAFLDYLLVLGREWDVLDLMALSQESALRSFLVEGRGRYFVKDNLDCWCIPLPATWDQYMSEHMNHKQRRNYRYHYRRVEKEHPGRVKYMKVEDPSGVSHALDRLGAMQTQRLSERGLFSPFNDPGYMAFHKEMAARALDLGWLRLYQLLVEDDVVAVFYLYRHRRDYYGYQMSFDESWNKYSPGVLLLAYVMQEAIKEGAASLDLSYGAEGYKDAWAECMLIDCHLISSHNWRGDLWLWGARTVEDAIKIGRKVLPEDYRQRGNRLLAATRRLPIFRR